MRTLSVIVARNRELGSGPPRIIIAHQTRSVACDEALFHLLVTHGFVVREVPHREHHPEYHHPILRIFEISVRPSE